jgi:hypothetical protein
LENRNSVHVGKLSDDPANHIADVSVETIGALTSPDDPDNSHSKHDISSELECRHRSARA